MGIPYFKHSTVLMNSISIKISLYNRFTMEPLKALYYFQHLDSLCFVFAFIADAGTGHNIWCTLILYSPQRCLTPLL